MSHEHEEQREWKELNARYFVDAKKISYYSYSIHEPSLIPFDLGSYSGPSAFQMREWIKRHTDTSIKIDSFNNFDSKGTIVYKIRDVIVNTETIDIGVLSNSGLKLLDCSHHGRECYSWILRRNQIVKLGLYVKWLYENANLLSTNNSEETFILNTRWASTNFYHWIHEAIPRICLMIRNGFIKDSTQLLWLGKHRPRDYHLSTLKALGIKVDEIKYLEGIISIKNLVHSTMVMAESFSPEQSKIVKFVADRIMENSYHKFDIKSNKRLLILRRNSNYRSFAFEEQVDKLISRYSLTPVFLEEMNLPEQINILQTADYLVAPHGAGLTHLLWMKEGTRIIEFMPQDSIHPLYWYLSGISNMKYSMIPSRIITDMQRLVIDLREFDDHFCM